MTFKSHYNIATEGIRAGHKSTATLGVRYHLEIIVTPIPPTSSGGGGGGHYHAPEKRYPYNPLFGVIHIEFYGKEENFKFYPIREIPQVQIEINLFKYTIDRNTNAIINVTLESSSKFIESPTFIIKDKNYDSTKRSEQARILVEHPKLVKSTR